VTRARQFGLAALAAAVCGAAAVAQQERPSRPRADSKLVVIPVSARDTSGNLVDGIPREAFRVLEDGVPQQVTIFSTDTYPLAALILLDHGLPRKQAETLQKSAGAIAGGFSEFDEAAVARFEAFFEPLADFTSNNDHLHSTLKSAELAAAYTVRGTAPMTTGPRINGQPVERLPGSGGVTLGGRPGKQIDDAVFVAARHVAQRAPDRRRVLLIVSDGNNSKGNLNSFTSVLRMLLDEHIVVYAVRVGGPPEDRAGDVLFRYALATGGAVFYAATREEMENAYGRITEQARNPYTLAYVPQGTDRKKDYHDIEVRVARTGLMLSARQGYYDRKENE